VFHPFQGVVTGHCGVHVFDEQQGTEVAAVIAVDAVQGEFYFEHEVPG